MAMQNELFEAMQLVASDPVSRRTFEAIRDEGGSAAGWALVKRVGADQDQLAAALAKLVQAGVLQGSGGSLDGFYSMTARGFQLRSQLAG